jgi:hypothetical protein
VSLSTIREGSTITVTGVDGHGALLTNADALRALPTFTVSELGRSSLAITANNWRGEGDITLRDFGVPYLVTREVTHGQNTLTLEEGVTLRFEVDTKLDLGWNSSDGEVQIRGTAARPVVFEGVSEEAGSWAGVLLGRNLRTSSRVEHLVIRGGGTMSQAALEVNAELRLTDVTIERSRSVGLSISAVGLREGSERVSVRDAGSHPIKVAGPGVLTTPVGGTFEGNAQQSVLIDTTCNNDKSGALPNPGIPYYFHCNMQVRNNASWTIPAGVTIQLGVDRSFEFGWNSSATTVKIEGTEDNPVVFEAFTQTPDQWRGLFIRRNVTSDSTIRHMIVRHGVTEPISGAQRGALLQLDRLVSIQDSRFEAAPGNGIQLPRNLANLSELEALRDANAFEVGGKGVCQVGFAEGGLGCD